MVRFIDFYFHFLAHFQTLTSPHMFSIFTQVTCRDTHSEPGFLGDVFADGVTTRYSVLP